MASPAPSLCSSQQSGDSPARHCAHRFCCCYPKRLRSLYPWVSERWVQPGALSSEHQGKAGCLSCLQAGLVPRQHWFPPWQEREGDPQPGPCRAGSSDPHWGGTGLLLSWALETPGDVGRAARQGSSPLPSPRRNEGDSASVPIVQSSVSSTGPWRGGTWEEGLSALPSAFGVSSYPGTQRGGKGSSVHRPCWCGCWGQRCAPTCQEPSSAGPCQAHVAASEGPSRGLSVAKILSLARSGELPLGSGEVAWLSQSGGGRHEQGAAGHRLPLPG